MWLFGWMVQGAGFVGVISESSGGQLARSWWLSTVGDAACTRHLAMSAASLAVETGGPGGDAADVG